MNAAEESKLSPIIETILTLKKNDELFVKIPVDRGGRFFKFEIIDGNAHILGVQLELNKVYKFRTSVSILAGDEGCTISVIKGKRYIFNIKDSTITTTEINTTMQMLRDYHYKLEDLRSSAECENKLGPVIAIVGPTDSGKSTSAIALINYAIQSNRTPIYVDLDLGQGKLSVPGTFAAVKAENANDFDGEFNARYKNMISYFVGSNNPGEHVTQHNLIVSKFAEALFLIMENRNSTSKHSGIIINTCGWVEGIGYSILKHILYAFRVDFILVLGSEPSSLIPNLHKDIPVSTELLLVPKSDLATTKTREFRKHERNRRVQEFFYNSQQTTMVDVLQNELKQENSVRKFEIDFFKVKICKLRTNQLKTAIQLSIIPPSKNHVYHLFGVSKGLNENDEDVLQLNGYVCLTKINLIRKTLTFIAPESDQPFIEAVLLISDMRLEK